MLHSQYDKTLVGLNYISLIHAIIGLKQESSILLLDNEKDASENNWMDYIGEVEKNILKQIGEKYEIACLQSIDKYIIPRNTLLIMDDLYIELSDSPYVNVHELARKLPSSLTIDFISEVESIGQYKFDQQVIEMAQKISALSHDSFGTKEMRKIFDQEEQIISSFYNSFMRYLEQEEIASKQLHNLLQMKYQTVFSSAKNELESKYLLFSLLAPRYAINNEELRNELLFDFRKLGGDLKSTKIQDWGIEGDQLNYVQLASIDGVVKTKQCYYFSPLRYHPIFRYEVENKRFMSIKIECLIDHDYVEFFAGKRILFSYANRMGSDFPFWEVYVDAKGNLYGTYCYADTLGTKASFYYPNALDDLYDSLLGIFPGLTREDWISRAKVSQGNDIWLEYAPRDKAKLAPENRYLLSKVFHKEENKEIRHFYYCGLERAKSLGLYSYLLDVFSRP